MKKILIAVVLVLALGAYWWWSTSHSTPTTPVATGDTPTSMPPPETTPSTSTPPTSPTGAQYKDGTYTGVAGNSVYGNIQVAAVIKGGALTDVQVLMFPKTPAHSLQVSNTSLPILQSEAITAQSAQVNVVSGATQTSEAFQQSLQSALTQAQA